MHGLGFSYVIFLFPVSSQLSRKQMFLIFQSLNWIEVFAYPWQNLWKKVDYLYIVNKENQE